MKEAETPVMLVQRRPGCVAIPPSLAGEGTASSRLAGSLLDDPAEPLRSLHGL